MKPLGTITLHLPFVDSGTKQTIMELMKSAQNYSNFSKRLTDRVCSSKARNLEVFSAVHHSTHLYDYDSLDKIARNYSDLSIIQPNLYFAGSYLRGKDQWVKARKVADQVFESTDNLWIKFEMLMSKLKVDVFDFTSESKTHDTVGKLESILKENSELQCLEYRYFDTMAQLAKNEGNHEEAIRCNDKALELSREYCDEFVEGHLHRIKASLIQRADHQLARQLLFVSKDILTSLGDKVGLSNVLHQLGLNNAIRGEYNSAIEYSLQAIRNRESLGMPYGMSASNLAVLFNAAGDYDNGLTWAELAEAEFANQVSQLPRAKLEIAWALAGQGKIDKAKAIVDGTREDILRSGIEPLLAQHYFTTGLVEFAETDYFAASVSFEKAYDINRRLGRAILDSVCLYYLAKTEVISLEVDETNRDADSSGHWLRLLEEIAESKDLPGIKAQVILLNAHHRMKQGRYEEARTMIDQVIQVAEQASMTFLHQESEDLMRKLNH